MPQYGRKTHTFSFAATGTTSVDWEISWPDWLFHSYVIQTPTFSGGSTLNSGCSAVTVKIIDEDGYTLFTSANHASAGTVVVTGMDSIMGTGKELTIRITLAGGSSIVEQPQTTQSNVILILYLW